MVLSLIHIFTISMKSTDYLKMPDCVINEVPVTLSEDEMELYHTMKNDLILNLDDGDVDAVNAAALAGKLSQMANGAVYDENGNAVRIHDRKLDALEDLIEAANGKPVLVAYWFKHDLERIEKRLHSLHIPFSKLDTPDSITRWNRGELPVALVHPASAGHGLNLQSCLLYTSMWTSTSSTARTSSGSSRTAVSRSTTIWWSSTSCRASSHIRQNASRR